MLHFGGGVGAALSVARVFDVAAEVRRSPVVVFRYIHSSSGPIVLRLRDECSTAGISASVGDGE